MQNLEINITGKAGTGKTFISLIIKKALEEHGFSNVNYSNVEDDWKSKIDQPVPLNIKTNTIVDINEIHQRDKIDNVVKEIIGDGAVVHRIYKF